MSKVFGVTLPVNWSATRLKSVVTHLSRGTAPDYVDEGDVRAISQAANQDGKLDWTRTRFHKFDGPPSRLKGYLKAGDILINSTGTGTLGRVGFFVGTPDGIPCMADSHVTIVRTDDTVANSRYAYYWLRSQQFQNYVYSALAVGATNQIELNREGLANAPFPLPSLEEQRRIADFLDAKTAHLDRVIQLREKSIHLLEERLESEIDKAIRGSGRQQKKAATYHPLGAVPTAWNEGRLRNADCDVQTGPFGSQLHAEDYVSNAWPVINPANIAPSGLVPDANITVTDEVRDRLSRHILRSGDVIFGRRGELGRAAIVTADEDGWLCGTGCLRLRFRNPEAFHSGYLHRFLGIPVIRHYFQLNAIGSTMANLSTSILMNMPLLMPPITEQVNLARHCEEIERSAVDHVRLLRRQVELFQERRHALITAAVTGQFDVSTASGRGVTE